MLRNTAGVFKGFDALNSVNHVFQRVKLRFIKNYACVRTFMQVGFCKSSWNSIKDTLHMKPWNHVMNWAQNVKKEHLFMQVLFEINNLYFFCYTCRRHWKNFFERKNHKLYEMFKSYKNLWIHTNVLISLKTMIKCVLFHNMRIY